MEALQGLGDHHLLPGQALQSVDQMLGLLGTAGARELQKAGGVTAFLAAFGSDNGKLQDGSVQQRYFDAVIQKIEPESAAPLLNTIANDGANQQNQNFIGLVSSVAGKIEQPEGSQGAGLTLEAITMLGQQGCLTDDIVRQLTNQLTSSLQDSVSNLMNIKFSALGSVTGEEKARLQVAKDFQSDFKSEGTQALFVQAIQKGSKRVLTQLSGKVEGYQGRLNEGDLCTEDPSYVQDLKAQLEALKVCLNTETYLRDVLSNDQLNTFKERRQAVKVEDWFAQTTPDGSGSVFCGGSKNAVSKTSSDVGSNEGTSASSLLSASTDDKGSIGSSPCMSSSTVSSPDDRSGDSGFEGSPGRERTRSLKGGEGKEETVRVFVLIKRFGEAKPKRKEYITE